MLPEQFNVSHVFGPVLSKKRHDQERWWWLLNWASDSTRCAPKWTSECYLKHLVGTTSGLIVQVHSPALSVWVFYWCMERRKGAGEWPSSSENRPLKSAIFSYLPAHETRLGRSTVFNRHPSKILSSYLFHSHPIVYVFHVWHTSYIYKLLRYR